MNVIAFGLLATPVTLLLYSYVLYPLILRVVAAFSPVRDAEHVLDEWPFVSISVPVYNEAAQTHQLIESLLALDYPTDRRQILIVSDASDDGTDDIVRSWASRGVELLRMPARSGKTAAENAGARMLRGEIIVNTDASIRIDPAALKRIIAVFADPTIGAASGRDVSVARTGSGSNEGEAGYVDYEMKVRSLETRVGGIVGASGCFYAIRSELHRVPLPEWLSRDFAAAMITRRAGFRTVSVDDAICLVPRTTSLHREYRRKVRTMSRGMKTLHHMRQMLNPFRYGSFAWMLFSHKICRWLVPPAGVVGLTGLALLAPRETWAATVLAAAAAAIIVGAAAWALHDRRSLSRPLAVLAYALAGNVAAIHAGVGALKGDLNAIWEPTRRDATAS